MQNLYNSPTFPDILAAGRRELSHSAFLAWLFNMSANHGLGTVPVLQLLELFVRCSREQNKKLDSVLMNAILSRSITINNTIIKTEYNIKNRGRADIDIDLTVDWGVSNTSITNLRIVIENKVYSNEHDNQTCNYFEFYEKEKKPGEQICYIYLTPLLHEKEADCPAFVHITYQDLLNNVFEPILLLPNLSQRTRFILTEYINCLSIPVEEFTGNKKNIKRTTIMAISNNERSLLEAFWEKHEKLIMAIHTARASDPNLDDEEREIHEKVLAQYNNKDYSKYSVNGEGAYKKSPLVKRVVECYLEKNPHTTIEKLKEIFPYKLQGGGFGVICSKDDIQDEKRKMHYNELILPSTGETIYVCKRWRGQGGNFDKFIKHIEEKIPEIKITQI